MKPSSMYAYRRIEYGPVLTDRGMRLCYFYRLRRSAFFPYVPSHGVTVLDGRTIPSDRRATARRRWKNQ